MADVSKVQGPAGPPESFGKKDKGSVDADKFKEAMHRRVTEVSAADPDEQKKRKRQEEAEGEEDVTEEAPQAPTTPPSQVAPFSLEKEQKKTSPLEMQQGGPGISPTESSQKASLPSPLSTPFPPTPSSDEMADDSGLLEEESFIENIPSPAQQAATPTLGQPEETVSQPPEQPTLPTEVPLQPQQTQPQVKEKEQAQQPSGKKPPSPPVGPPPTKKTPPFGMAPKPFAPQKKEAGPVKTEGGTTAAEMEERESTAKVQDTTGFFEQLGKEGEGGKKGMTPVKTPEEEEGEVQGVVPLGQPTPFAAGVEEKEGKKEEGKETPPEMGAAIPQIPGELPGALPSPPTPEPLSPYAHLHPEVMELFDRMVGVMTVMSMSGLTETTFTLNSPQFASSVFFGTQIVIQEFSTAPQSFNIQLNGSPQAIALFQANTDDLMAAFQASNYNFRINRLETGYLSDRPLFKRKEKAGENEKETGENPS